MVWVTNDGNHEGYVLCLFADGMAGGGWADGGVTVNTGPDGTLLPYDEWRPRPPAEVVGWRAACDCAPDGHWWGSRWERAGVTDSASRRLNVADDLADDLTYNDEITVFRDEWKQLHLGAGYEQLADVRTAADAAAAARHELDAAVAAARAAGASWADVGQAAGMTRQSAHERWGG